MPSRIEHLERRLEHGDIVFASLTYEDKQVAYALRDGRRASIVFDPQKKDLVVRKRNVNPLGGVVNFVSMGALWK
ncbi:MAG TPA: hypothetical protein VEA15_00400 [Caulobacteraceae bacterium]|nr:hypothetical protein [Caulobacteraceae bacterium]